MERTTILSYRQLWILAVALMMVVTVAAATPEFTAAAPKSTTSQGKEDFKRKCIAAGGEYYEGVHPILDTYFGCKRGDGTTVECVEGLVEEQGWGTCETNASRGKPAVGADEHLVFNTNAQLVQEVNATAPGQSAPEFHGEDIVGAAAPIVVAGAAAGETPCQGGGKWCRIVCTNDGLCDWVCTDCIGQPATAEVVVARAVVHPANQAADQQLVAGDRGDSSPPTAASKPKKDDFKDNFKGACKQSTYDGKPATYSETSDGKYRCTLPSGTIVQCDPVAVDLLGGWKGCTVIAPSSDNGKPATQEPNRPTAIDVPQLVQPVEPDADETAQASDDIVRGEAPSENATAAQGHEANGQQIAPVDGASHTAAASEEDADDA